VKTQNLQFGMDCIGSWGTLMWSVNTR